MAECVRLRNPPVENSVADMWEYGICMSRDVGTERVHPVTSGEKRERMPAAPCLKA